MGKMSNCKKCLASGMRVHILSNGFYVGVMTHGDKKTKHCYDTIISKRLFRSFASTT